MFDPVGKPAALGQASGDLVLILLQFERGYPCLAIRGQVASRPAETGADFEPVRPGLATEQRQRDVECVSAVVVQLVESA